MVLAHSGNKIIFKDTEITRDGVMAVVAGALSMVSYIVCASYDCVQTCEMQTESVEVNGKNDIVGSELGWSIVKTSSWLFTMNDNYIHCTYVVIIVL